MKCVAKMKCSPVVDRAAGRTGGTGAEMLEWRSDRRNLSVLVKKVTGIISIYILTQPEYVAIPKYVLGQRPGFFRLSV